MALAWLRFLFFAVIPLGGYLHVSEQFEWGAALAGAGLVLFCIAVRVHKGIQAQSRTLGLLREIIGESAKRIGGEPVIVRSGEEPPERSRWRALFDNLDGDAPRSELTAQETGDLDVFGDPLSLFGLLNRTSTPIGAARLADSLTRPCRSNETIAERQRAAEWMTEHPLARLQLTAAAAAIRPMPREFSTLYETVRDATAMPNRGFLAILRFWGLAGPIALALGFANQVGWDGVTVGWLPLILVVILNAVLMQLFLRPVRARIRPWLNLDGVVAAMTYFSQTAIEVLPDSDRLGEQRRKLSAALRSGRLPSLQWRIPLLFLGLSGFMHTIIDLLVFWDLQVLWLMESCYIKHRADLIDAIGAVGECELFASMGAFAWEESNACRPEFVNDPQTLEIEEGRHPLIAAGSAVCNSVRLTPSVPTWIVTGSNMSGKSTFLRMAATNVLLAQMGSAVTAGRMRLSPLEIMTDLRIRDDLSKQESYFLAEVRQVRRMVMAAQAGRPVLALIDEPFRGTNSAERVAAASAVISALMAGSGVHIIATHDAALTSLADEAHARNYHFQEHFDRDELVFDYTLLPGPAKSRNALRVLEAEHYPEEVVRRAKAILGQLGDDGLEAPPSVS